MKSDPAIEEIRNIRKRISEECDHDPKLLVARYRELEKRFKDRMLKTASARDATGTSDGE